MSQAAVSRPTVGTMVDSHPSDSDCLFRECAIDWTLPYLLEIAGS